jgi:hypothetical protein
VPVAPSRRRQQGQQAAEAGRHHHRRTPLAPAQALAEDPGGEDQRQRQLEHQDRLDRGELAGTQGGGLEQKTDADSQDPAEPHRLVQQAPDQPPAQVLAARHIAVGLALEHRGGRVAKRGQHREHEAQHVSLPIRPGRATRT